VNLPEEVVEELSRLAEREGTTMTQAMATAIANEAAIGGILRSGARAYVDRGGALMELVRA